MFKRQYYKNAFPKLIQEFTQSQITTVFLKKLTADCKIDMEKENKIKLRWKSKRQEWQ